MKIKHVLNTCAVIFVSLMLAACAQTSDRTTVGRSSGAPANNNLTASATTACGAAAGAVGRVFDDSSSSSSTSFEERVRGLISADYDPSSIGSISSTNAPSATCVTLQGTLRFDSAGNLAAGESNLALAVYDSNSTQLDVSGKVAGPFPINFKSAKIGNLNRDQAFTVTFEDPLGTLVMSGSIVQGQARGIIQYANLQSFNGGAGAQGLLGAFAINTSSLLK